MKYLSPEIEIVETGMQALLCGSTFGGIGAISGMACDPDYEELN